YASDIVYRGGWRRRPAAFGVGGGSGRRGTGSTGPFGVMVFALYLGWMNNPLVWIDCEMTGLDIERDALIEIACVVTDSALNMLDGGIALIINAPAEELY